MAPAAWAAVLGAACVGAGRVPDESWASDFQTDGLEVLVEAHAGADRFDITIRGSKGVWFAVGLGAERMNGTWVVGVDSTGALLEETLGEHNAGEHDPRNATIKATTVAHRERKVTLSVPVGEYVFARDKPMPFVWAHGMHNATALFGYHGRYHGRASMLYERMTKREYRHTHSVLALAACGVVSAAVLARRFGPLACKLERSSRYLHAFLVAFGSALCALALLIAHDERLEARQPAHGVLTWPLVTTWGVYSVLSLCVDFSPAYREGAPAAVLHTAGTVFALIAFALAAAECALGVVSLFETEDTPSPWRATWVAAVAGCFGIPALVAGKLFLATWHRPSPHASPVHRTYAVLG